MEPAVEYEQLHNDSSGTLEKPPRQTQPQPTQPQPTQPQPPPQQQSPAHMMQPPPAQMQPQFQPQFQPMPQVQYQPVQGHFQPMQGQAVAYPVVQYYTQQPVPQPQIAVAQPQVAVAQPPAQVQIHNATSASQPPQKWPWCHLVTSVFAFFCCQPFGLIALVMSLLAYADHKAKDFKRSHNKRNVALGFGIASIVIGCISGILVIALTAWAISAAASISNSYYDSYNNNNNDNCFSDYGYSNHTVWNGTDWACASVGSLVSSQSSLLAPFLLLAYAIYQAIF